MEKCNNCRWYHNEMCCNIAVYEIKEECNYFFSYDEMENLSNSDEDTNNILGDL